MTTKWLLEGEKAYEIFKTYAQQKDVNFQHIRNIKKAFEATNTTTNYQKISLDQYLG